ncbi:polysaccharide deacetylase family protein [Actinomadura terrae]|uniref:polysaccharide deacetylase family protein n=1 Tax=Actinomadura terrae TaxID=604353 RepID=UPI001FA73FE4|nr:polysaccharide deacetylase family protein [Actinomadura terrae]
MLYAGVAWHSSGYEVMFTRDAGSGGAPVPSERFGSTERDALVAHLRSVADRSDEELVSVVDSTNGIIDGLLMAVGLRVHRADPWSLPERPVLGSVRAADLAEAARRDLAQLDRLTIDDGTLTGRVDEQLATMKRSAAAEAPLRAAGRWFTHGARDERVVALTFDDGPQPPYTGQVLDILDHYGVPATFFCVGLNALERSKETGRMLAAGHTVANHTWSHAYLPDLTQEQLREQLARTFEVLPRIDGEPVRYFRPPYGSRSPEVVGWLAEEDVTTVTWDVDAEDWTLPSPEKIAADVLRKTEPGSVILLHDGGGDRSRTVASVPLIIEGLQERGYRFVLLDELKLAI